MIDSHEAGILVRLRQKHFRFLKEDICVPERSPQLAALDIQDVCLCSLWQWSDWLCLWGHYL